LEFNDQNKIKVISYQTSNIKNMGKFPNMTLL